jgi:hypothetical protein
VHAGAGAGEERRIEQPVYHVALAFDPHDEATPAMMRRAADRLVADLGLAEHQVLMVAHGTGRTPTYT